MKPMEREIKQKISARKYFYDGLKYMVSRGVFSEFSKNANKLAGCYSESFSPEAAVNYVFGEMI